MILTRKTQVNPSHFTQNTLWSISNICNDLWNISNEQRQYRSGFGKVNVYSQKKELTQLKKENQEFKLPSSQVLQNVLFALDRSYKMFFTKLKKGDKKVNLPRFKSKKYFFTQEYSQYGTSFVIEDNVIKLAYGKNKKDWLEIPFKDSRSLPNEKIKTLSEISWDDIKDHGFLTIVIPNEQNEDFFIKYGERGIISSDNKEPTPYNLITKEKNFDEVPFSVEPGDIYTSEVIDPDFIIHGKTLVNFLKKYFPQDNILKENKLKKKKYNGNKL